MATLQASSNLCFCQDTSKSRVSTAVKQKTALGRVCIDLLHHPLLLPRVGSQVWWVGQLQHRSQHKPRELPCRKRLFCPVVQTHSTSALVFWSTWAEDKTKSIYRIAWDMGISCYFYAFFVWILGMISEALRRKIPFTLTLSFPKSSTETAFRWRICRVLLIRFFFRWQR